MKTLIETNEWPETKCKIVDAGMKLMRTQGYNATSLDDICAAAGVTKGGFFHYFKSKEDLAKAALLRFSEHKAGEFLSAPFHQLTDPLERVYGRLDFMIESYGGASRTTKGCLIGTLAQELSFTHPELRETCQALFKRLAQSLEKDLAEAKSLYAPNADFDPKGLSELYVSIAQGSMMLAKATETNEVLVNNLEQFRAYLKMLFAQANRSARRETRVLAKSRN